MVKKLPKDKTLKQLRKLADWILAGRTLPTRLMIYYTSCPGKKRPPKQNAVKCTVYNTIQ